MRLRSPRCRGCPHKFLKLNRSGVAGKVCTDNCNPFAVHVFFPFHRKQSLVFHTLFHFVKQFVDEMLLFLSGLCFILFHRGIGLCLATASPTGAR